MSYPGQTSREYMRYETAEPKCFFKGKFQTLLSTSCLPSRAFPIYIPLASHADPPNTLPADHPVFPLSLLALSGDILPTTGLTLPNSRYSTLQEAPVDASRHIHLDTLAPSRSSPSDHLISQNLVLAKSRPSSQPHSNLLRHRNHQESENSQASRIYPLARTECPAINSDNPFPGLHISTNQTLQGPYQKVTPCHDSKTFDNSIPRLYQLPCSTPSLSNPPTFREQSPTHSSSL